MFWILHPLKIGVDPRTDTTDAKLVVTEPKHHPDLHPEELYTWHGAHHSCTQASFIVTVL